MKPADNILRRLVSFARGHGYEIIIPNFYYGQYEMDLFRLMPSGYVVEYEVKMSRNDFRNDFKKAKIKIEGGYWHHHENGVRYEDMPKVRVTKHDLIAAGQGACNRFFFVTPENLVKPEEIPAHAGLIYYCGPLGMSSYGGHFRIVKNAPLIKRDKVKDEEYKSIAGSLAFREWNHRAKAYISASRNDKQYNKTQQLLAIINSIPPGAITQPVGMPLKCPQCGMRHIDDPVMAKRPHTEHLCEGCDEFWEPYQIPTYGI